MSASTRTAPAQLSFGRFPSALAGLALVVILAVAVAIVALNGAKTTAPAATSGFGHGPGDWYYTAPAAVVKGAPPVVIDHGWSNGQTVIRSKTIQAGGFGGPRLADPNYVAPSVLEQTKDNTFGGRVSTGGGHNGARRAQ